MELDREDTIDLIKDLALVAACLFIIGVGFLIYHHHVVRVPYEKTCEDKPSERYKEVCTTKTDCVQKCADRLYKESST